MEIEEGVTASTDNTLPDLHNSFIRKPNSIIVLLFIQNNSLFKNMAKTLDSAHLGLSLPFPCYFFPQTESLFTGYHSYKTLLAVLSHGTSCNSELYKTVTEV